MNSPYLLCKRLTVLLLILFFIFSACKGKRSPVADAAKPVSVVPPKPTRAGLIAALRDLNRRAASKDSMVVADIYDFPMPDSVMDLFLDSAFDAIKTKNGGVVTKSMFLSNYDRLHAQLGLEDMVRLFKDIDVAGLQKTDTIQYEENPKKDISYELGSLEASGDTLVFLMYGTNYNDKHEGTKEEQENADMGAYDHNTFWTFAYDGRKLKLIKLGRAD